MAIQSQVNLKVKVLSDMDEISSEAKRLKETLENIKVSESFDHNITKDLDSLIEQTKKFQELNSKSKKKNSDLTGMENSQKKISNAWQDIIDKVQKLNNKDLQKLFKIDTSDLDAANNKVEEIKKNLQSQATSGTAGGYYQNLINSLKELNKLSKSSEVRSFGENFKDLTDIERADKALKQLSSDSNTIKGRFSENGTSADKFDKILTNLTEDFEKYKKEIQSNTEYASLVAQLNEAENSAEEFKKQIANLPNEELQQLISNWKQVKESTDEVTESERQAAEQQKNFNDNVESMKSKINYFFGMENAIQLVKRAISDAVDTVKELDASMTETAVVSDETVGSMWSNISEYTDSANKLGVAINDIIQAQTLYVQQGLDLNNSLGLAEETMKMARISGLEAADATDAMTAALRGFNKEVNGSNAEWVNDVYSKLAAITASDVEELSTAMEKTASIASSANMEFETTAAFLSQIIETTREAPETAGTALKTIIARFSEVKQLYSEGELTGTDDEGESIDVNKVSAALKTAGINMNDFFTGAKGLDDVLLELASKWDSLDLVQQRYIATQAAGSRQQSRFIAMMSNYDRTVELVDSAYNSAGASEEQFEKTQDSLESKLNKLKNAWDEFTTGIANSTVIKTAVDIATEFLTVLNNITGNSGIMKLIAAFGMFEASSWGLNKALRAVSEVIGKSNSNQGILSGLKGLSNFNIFSKGSLNGIKEFIKGIKSASTAGVEAAAANKIATEEFFSAFKTGAGTAASAAETTAAKIGVSFVEFLPEITLAVAAITALGLAFKWLYDNYSLEGLTKQAEEAAEAFEDQKDKVEDLKSEIEELTTQIDELENSGPLELTEQHQLELLKAEKVELIEQKKVEEELLKIKAEEAALANFNKENKISEDYSNDKKISDASKEYKKQVNNNGKILLNAGAAQLYYQEDNTEDRLELYHSRLESDQENLEMYDYLSPESKKKVAEQVKETVMMGLELGQVDAVDAFSQMASVGLIDGIDSDDVEEKIQELASKTNVLTGERENITRSSVNKLFGKENVDSILSSLEGEAAEKNTTAWELLKESLESYAEAAEEAAKETKKLSNQMINSVSDISSIEDGISSFTDALSNMQDEGYVSASTLQDIADTLEEAGVEADEYGEALGNLGQANTYEEASEAVNDLATAYLNSSSVMENLTEDTKGLYTAQLEQMGVSNAEEVVNYQLAKSMMTAAVNTGDFTSDLWDNVNGLIGDQENADDLRLSIWALGAQMAANSGDAATLSSYLSGNVTAMANVGGAASSLIEELTLLAEAYALLNRVEKGEDVSKSEIAAILGADAANEIWTEAGITNGEAALSSRNNGNGALFNVGSKIFEGSKLGQFKIKTKVSTDIIANSLSSWIENKQAEINQDLQDAIDNGNGGGTQIKVPQTTTSDGSGSSSNNTSDTVELEDQVNDEYRWTYRLLSKINSQLAIRERYEEKYQRLLDRTNSTGKDLLTNVNHQIQQLELVADESRQILNGWQARLSTTSSGKNYVNRRADNGVKYSDLTGYVWYNADANRVMVNTERVADLADYTDEEKNARIYKRANAGKGKTNKLKTFLSEHKMTIGKDFDYTTDLKDNSEFMKGLSDDEKEELRNLITSTINLGQEEIQEIYDGITDAEDYYKEIVKDVEDANDNLQSVYDAEKEIYENAQSSSIDLWNQILDAIVEQKQDVIDNMTDINDNIEDANSKLIDSIKDSIDKERQARDNQDTEDDIASKQRQLAYLKQDTSGANLTKIKQLEQEINDAQENYQDTLIDQQITAMEDAAEAAAEQRQQQIDLLQSQLDYDKENGNLWDEVRNLLTTNSGKWISSMTEDSPLYKLMSKSGSFVGLSEAEFKTKMDELNTAVKENYLYYNSTQVNTSNGVKTLAVGETFDLKTSTGKSKQATMINSTQYSYTGDDGKTYTGNIQSSGAFDSNDVFQQKSGQVSSSIKVVTSSGKQYDAKMIDSNGTFKYSTDNGTVYVGSIKSLPQNDDGTYSTNGNVEKVTDGYLSDSSLNVSHDTLVKSSTAVNTLRKGLNNLRKAGLIDITKLSETKGTITSDVTDGIEKLQKLVGYSKVNGKWSKALFSKIKDSGYNKYASGGLADYTGLAWLDGTPSNPEMVLNAKDTENFIQLKNALSDLSSVGGTSSIVGDTNYSVNISVDSIANDYDVDKMANRIKQIIYKDSSYRNNTSVKRIR